MSDPNEWSFTPHTTQVWYVDQGDRRLGPFTSREHAVSEVERLGDGAKLVSWRTTYEIGKTVVVIDEEAP